MALYIPTTFGSSGGGTIIASGSTSISGAIGMNSGWPFQQDYFVSNSITYSYWMWQGIEDTKTNVATFDILSGSTLNARLVAIGGGGGLGGGQAVFEPLNGWVAGGLALGGGGAGGVVEFNNFPLIPGHYNIVAGAGGAGISGISSSITLPLAIAQPFTSSYVVAYGGGRGGYADRSTNSKGTSGGSVGGNTQVPGNSSPVVSNPVLGAGLGGRSGGDQGRTSGEIPQSTSPNQGFSFTATGGGGFGASSAASTAGKYITDGGSGSLISIYPYNYNTSSYVATGGGAAGLPGNGGATSQSWQYSQQGGNAWGIGSGASVSASSFTYEANYGIVYLEYPYYFNPYPKLATDGLFFRLSATSLTGSIWTDLSGNGNDAIVYGNYMTSSLTGWNFNGTNNYLTFPVSMSGYPVSQSFTLQWYGTKMNDGNVWYHASGSGNPTGDNFGNGWETLQTGSNKTLYTWVQTNWGGTGGPVASAKLYINDSIFWSDYDLGIFKQYEPFQVPNIPWQFGYSTFSSVFDPDTKYLSGSASDILLYNRPLDVSEIANNYKYFQTLPTVPTGSTNRAAGPISNGLTLYLATGSYSSSTGIWYDESGNGNNGILSGSALTGSTDGWLFKSGSNNVITFNSNLTAIPSSSFTLQWLTTMQTNVTNTIFSNFNSGTPLDRWQLISGTPSSPSSSTIGYFNTIGPPFQFYNINTLVGSKTLFSFVATEGSFPTFYSGSTYVGEIARGAQAFNSATRSYYFGGNYSGSVSSILIYNKELSETEINWNNVYLSSL